MVALLGRARLMLPRGRARFAFNLRSQVSDLVLEALYPLAEGHHVRQKLLGFQQALHFPLSLWPTG